MSNAPIGVIDSGVGGLTILKEIQRQLPDESFVYIGDTVNCPYGGRTPDDIYRLSANLIRRLRAMGAKLVVIACNTISVTCIRQLRADFPGLPIVGTVPAVKTAAQISRARRIGVLSTVVSQRTAEIGVRLAFGAERRAIFRLIVGRGLILASIGMAIGTAAALGLTRTIQTLLVGVRATDPATFGAIVVLFILVAAAACGIPAYRASRLDPLVALRNE